MIEPATIQALPHTSDGIPIPWFLAQRPGIQLDFRIADSAKRTLGFRQSLCWICGQTLDRLRVFIGGPSSCLNRVFNDWCSHPDCALYAIHMCPFLNGSMKRRPGKVLPDGLVETPGFITVRPPVTGLYYTSLPATMDKNKLFAAGAPRYIHWYKDTTRISDLAAKPLIAEWLKKIQP